MLRFAATLGSGAMQAAESRAGTRGFGVFEVDERAGELRKRGVRIKLQEQPFQLLCLLLDHSGEVVTREELRQRLWPAHTFVDFDRSLNKAMTKLRSTLGDSAENPRYIETIPRHGYRFLAPMRYPTEGAKAPAIAHVAGEQPQVQTIATGGSGQLLSFVEFLNVRTRIGRRRIAVLVATFAMVMAGVAYLRVRASTSLFGTSRAANLRQSVAVLGFKNLSGETREAWLSAALSDWLMTELTAGEYVRAIPAESVARMKMELVLPDVDSLSRDSLMRIRKNLGTDYVVVGSYATLAAKSDGQIRLDLRLQDTRSGETIGAISEVGTEEHLLDLVSRAGEELRKKLGVRAVTSEEAAEVAIALPTKSETAKLYSEGLVRLRAFDALKARDLLQSAIAVEPNYALSHAALATAWAQLGYDENAKAEAKNAFDLSSNLSRAEHLVVEGRYQETSREWDKAAEIYRALFEFFPDNLDYGLALANAEYRANKWKDTLATVDSLHRLPAPLRDDPRIDLAEQDAARSLGDTTRSEQALARAVERAQAAGASLLLAKARLGQAWLFENLGRFSEAEAAVREAKQLYIAANDRGGVAEATTIGAIALKNQGNYVGAKQGYEEVLGLYRQIGNRTGLAGENDNIGDILVYLGDLDGARRGYAAALAIYHQLGDQNGEALAKNGLGDVFLALGDHQQAMEMFESAFEICGRIGNRGRQAVALDGEARVHRLRGDLPQAIKQETEARTIFEDIGDKTEVAHVDLHIAELFMDEGDSAQAARLARHAADVFEKTKGMSGQASANLLLARTLLMNSRIADANKLVEQVLGVARETHNRELELLTVLTAARIGAASGNSVATKQALRRLDKVIADATATRFEELVMEARLIKGEMEMQTGAPSTGRAKLEALQKDAKKEGFQLIARKVSAALQTNQSQAARGAGNQRPDGDPASAQPR
jgi:DNA-binding winged helix-turn-helix (wHTH) protein/tetratricopeptide (TPR) repeat protein/TolB-like protein